MKTEEITLTISYSRIVRGKKDEVTISLDVAGRAHPHELYGILETVKEQIKTMEQEK